MSIKKEEDFKSFSQSKDVNQQEPTGALFLELFDVKEIQKIQDTFAKATSVASIITTTEGLPITKPSNFCRLCGATIRKTKKGLKNCYTSDAILGKFNANGPRVQPCLSGGLWDAGASIYAGNIHIANWIIGQVRNESTDVTRMKQYALEIGADMQEFMAALDEVPIMSKEKLEEISRFLFLMANQMSRVAYQNLKQKKFIEALKRTRREKKELQTRLQRAQKMEMLGALAGGVAHDLNNLLSGITSYPELLLLELPETDPNRKALKIIKSTGDKATTLVQDLLTMARRGVMVRKVISLNSIVKGFFKSAEFKKIWADNPKIRIQSTLAKDLMDIEGAPVHLEKTLLNLVINACEAMPSGGKLEINTSNHYLDHPLDGFDKIQEGDYAILKVIDEGVGIPAKDLYRIFEPFYSKKKLGRSGSGLGMAVVWGVVMDHEGYINVESRENHGTKFTLYFPITRRTKEDFTTDAPLKSLKGHGENILVVDDVKHQRNISCEMLKRLGYNAYSVANGEEAVEYVRKTPVDLLVLDMIMEPGMDGLDTYRRILDVHPAQKAIIASGYAETERVQEALALGAAAYIKKPYSMRKLGRTILAELQKTPDPPDNGLV